MFNHGMEMSGRAFVVMMRWLLCVTLISFLQGCGFQQMKGEQFAVDGAWSRVMIAYKERDDAVAWLAPVLDATGGENARLAATYVEVKAKVSALNAAGMVTQEPVVFMTMKANLLELTAATTALMDAASKTIGAGGPAISKQERNRWIEALPKVSKATREISVARQQYTLAVGTFNDIIKVFPNSYTARAVGFKMLPTFDSQVDSTGHLVTQTLTQSVGASKE